MGMQETSGSLLPRNHYAKFIRTGKAGKGTLGSNCGSYVWGNLQMGAMGGTLNYNHGKPVETTPVGTREKRNLGTGN